jgi:hypothetical protein
MSSQLATFAVLPFFIFFMPSENFLVVGYPFIHYPTKDLVSAKFK